MQCCFPSTVLELTPNGVANNWFHFLPESEIVYHRCSFRMTPLTYSLFGQLQCCIRRAELNIHFKNGGNRCVPQTIHVDRLTMCGHYLREGCHSILLSSSTCISIGNHQDKSPCRTRAKAVRPPGHR